MKTLVFILRGLSFFIFILLAASCKKDISIDDQDEAVFSMKFKFSGFTSQIKPFSPEVKSASTSLYSKNKAEVDLYFWSFNNRNLIPDVKFREGNKPSMSFVDSDIPINFQSSSYNTNDYIGGEGISLPGANELVVKMPIRDVKELRSIGFDVGSSNTGAKDFEIYYSINRGTTYEVLAPDNPFSDISVTFKKHSFVYDLSDKQIIANELWIKISPKAGKRPGHPFDTVSGGTRLDNFYLRGVAPVGPPSIYYNKLHYFIFDKSTQDIIVSGEENWEDIETLDVDLPSGEYSVCFMSNASDNELFIPQELNMSSFYASNVFSNLDAEIFGYIGDLTVSDEQTVSVNLERWFSQVKIEFTDGSSLDKVVKIIVEQEHAPFYFAPFNRSMTSPIVDNSYLEYVQDFTKNKPIVFNQFLGQLSSPQTVSYNLHVYDSKGVLKTLNLSSAIKNNMQLHFKGGLLHGLAYGSNFSVFKNENWNGTELVEF